MNAAVETRLKALGTSASDVEERFIRGGGPGGQKINKTSSSVTLRHRPTGLEVRCQQERSQAVNREVAWTLLCAKLEARRTGEIATVKSAQELNRRRVRQKSRGQKLRMVQTKIFRAKIKGGRKRLDLD